MDIIDRAVSAILPPESDEARAQATRKARAAAEPGDWLSHAIDQHERIRAAFQRARAAEPAERPLALNALALVLNGHAFAEEIVLYPALAEAHEKGHAMTAYTEQTNLKMQMAELMRIDTGLRTWVDKLEHVRIAGLRHMYEEENDWFLKLKRKGVDQTLLTERFVEEFERYVGEEADAQDYRSPARGYEQPSESRYDRGDGAGYS